MPHCAGEVADLGVQLPAIPHRARASRRAPASAAPAGRPARAAPPHRARVGVVGVVDQPRAAAAAAWLRAGRRPRACGRALRRWRRGPRRRRARRRPRPARSSRCARPRAPASRRGAGRRDQLELGDEAVAGRDAARRRARVKSASLAQAEGEHAPRVTREPRQQRRVAVVGIDDGGAPGAERLRTSRPCPARRPRGRRSPRGARGRR